MSWLIPLLLLNTAASVVCGLAFLWWSRRLPRTKSGRVDWRLAEAKWSHLVRKLLRARRAQALHGIFGGLLSTLSTSFRYELSAVFLGQRRRHVKA